MIHAEAVFIRESIKVTVIKCETKIDQENLQVVICTTGNGKSLFP